MKKSIFIIAAAIVAVCSYSPLSAQERDRGYRGSVSYSNMELLWNGIETSHGYMFDSHHYLGAGVGIYKSLPISVTAGWLGYAFAEYHAYWFDRKSTPTAGIRIGCLCSLPDTGNLLNVGIEPDIGWSWLFKSGNGLSLSLGFNIIPEAVRLTETSSFPFTIVPCLHFGFEF